MTKPKKFKLPPKPMPAPDSPAPDPAPPAVTTPQHPDLIAMAAAALGLEPAELRKLMEARELLKKTEQEKAEVGDPLPGAPPMPPEHPSAGDKTPDLVKWYHRWWPKEYERRYRGRRTILSPRKSQPTEPGEDPEENLSKGFPVDDPRVFTAGIQRDPRISDLPPILPGGLIDPDNPKII